LSEQENEWSKQFWGKILFCVIVLPIIMWIWPEAVPFKFFEFWNIRGNVIQWLYSAWPIFAWGTGVATIIAICTRNDRDTNRHAEKIIARGTLISIFAGIAEEVIFRWLFLLGAIVLVKIGNFLFFGFLGFGIPSWLHLHAFGPLANWITLGHLEPYLFHSTGWAVGAAMLSANSFFRDGHKYQGSFGWVNSWFIGMFLFWIMFQYGLLAAILAHFVYDLLIFTVLYVDASIERARGNA